VESESNVEIIEYNDSHHADFKRLNLEWLDKYQLTESHDLMVLDKPKEIILGRGGFIWVAKAGDEIIGTAALMKEEDHVYELAKMSVTANWQGKGISRLLIETCVAKAKAVGAKKIILFSNHQLTTAIGLYKKYGFHHVEVKDSPFASADVKMELNL
jgi:N-acetylglutamate synthase-like GNAT family acetyltransferase